jgi:hypothetical protein
LRLEPSEHCAESTLAAGPGRSVRRGSRHFASTTSVRHVVVCFSQRGRSNFSEPTYRSGLS